MKPYKNEGSIQLVLANADGTLVTLEKVLYLKKRDRQSAAAMAGR